ncbi:replication initiation regulator SeqA [Actinobacillus succinogenes]|uniref:Negative modulator of initiation of replication n=1 Tax=Actinobacillus succinogenes (strain ATCC 55618 / DSM 22257 / CCUG 43843 / 130Z) TaxID=339671 RepID=SEQA_ACTSZ|nr:replication initiation negative regulator SeqA [Actinobacillus succinogenes]A6VMY4.1 RecName: Full=Negative modulator of initiation of replication [Actinobacillus succinogenes 130Z]ABR74331.1 SeqA family protein [Actinobacillus succinogenes 130Z]PHI39246.1 replication initiation regulator SeqA [Actinobacillus succinogenes]
MKIIEVDEELYQFIASHTQSIGESASDILRRLLNLPTSSVSSVALETVAVESAEAANPETPSAVKNDFVLEPVAEKSSLEKTVKKQPEQVICHIVNKVRQVIESEAFQHETKAVVRFLAILTALYRTNPEGFSLAIESEQVQGRTRVYFARDEATLLAAGTHTKPKQIPDTPYWVITNNNSGRKMIMLEGVMHGMQLPDELIEDIRGYFIVN